MRLIDADALIERAEKDKGVTWYCYDEVKALLEDTPTIDAASVVRCKDCKYDEQCLLQSFVRDNSCDNVPYTKNWFCADGERKAERPRNARR